MTGLLHRAHATCSALRTSTEIEASIALLTPQATDILTACETFLKKQARILPSDSPTIDKSPARTRNTTPNLRVYIHPKQLILEFG